MKTDHLVNGYVLANLFYELLFLKENGVSASMDDWADPAFMDGLIRKLVVPQFEAFTPPTKTVVHNTLRYLLATKDDSSETWETIWQAASAPIRTPGGIRGFMQQVNDILFGQEPAPSKE